jgi:hypothetical protein
VAVVLAIRERIMVELVVLVVAQQEVEVEVEHSLQER